MKMTTATLVHVLTACASYLCHTGEHFKGSVPQKESRPSALAQTLSHTYTAMTEFYHSPAAPVKYTCISTSVSIGAQGTQDQLLRIKLTVTGIEWRVMVAAILPNSRGEKKTPSPLCLNQRAAENERLVLCSGTGRQFYV